MTVVLFQAGAVSVVDTTTFGMLFIRLPNSPALSSMAGQAAAKPFGPLVSIWFRFDWTLPSGSPADFECVDMLELDEDGLITALHIFYDTAGNRQAFERETGGSWRPAG